MTLTPEQIEARKGKLWDRCIPEPNSGCWLWLGHINPKTGRGTLSIEDKTHSVSRLSYELHIGAIPKGMIVRHTCDIGICINPDHLIPGTAKQNHEDMTRRQRNYWGAQSHCKNGHQFSSENTRTRTDGGRRCVACQKEASRRWNERRPKRC